jgi:hypothetical protein
MDADDDDKGFVFSPPLHLPTVGNPSIRGEQQPQVILAFFFLVRCVDGMDDGCTSGTTALGHRSTVVSLHLHLHLHLHLAVVVCAGGVPDHGRSSAL